MFASPFKKIGVSHIIAGQREEAERSRLEHAAAAEHHAALAQMYAGRVARLDAEPSAQATTEAA